MATTAITDGSFETEVLKNDNPVLVDFWAEWCGPCRALGPKLEELSQELDGKLKIVKLNIDENPNVTSQFGIRSIPTMIIFKGGESVETLMGNQSKENIAEALNKHI